MKSLLDASYREELLGRLEQLSPASPRGWGTMNVGQMLCHLSDQLRFAVGELRPDPSPSGLLTWRPVQWFGIVVAPWPRGRVSTSPQLLQTTPAAFERDAATLRNLIDRFVSAAEVDDLSPHPMFGSLSTNLWGRLAGRHVDHHLRQFGV